MADVSPYASGEQRPSIAILPWGDVIEDFLDPLGLEARRYVSQASGGWLFGYVAALQGAGWRPVVVWASRNVSSAERLINNATSASVWLVPGRSHPIGRWNAKTSVRRWLSVPIAAIRQAISLEGCRAMLVQEYEDPRFDRFVHLGRQINLPVYATFQGGDLTASWLEERIRPISLSKSAGLIIPSASERVRVQEKYGSRLPSISNIPNPVDIDEWQRIPQAVARQHLGLDQDCFLVLTHGRVDIHRKGLDVLVRTWMALEPGGGERLVIIGSGQDDDRFRCLLAELSPKGLEWKAGYCTDRGRILTWLSAADLYVTASRTEGMPVAPLEAMSCGLPIVASDAHGLADILSEGEDAGGLLVPRDDPASMAAAIRRLRDDPNLRLRLGRVARRRIEKHYSLAAVSRQLRGLLKCWV